MSPSHDSRRIAPHATPASSLGDSSRTTRLPTELLSEQAQRLVVFSTVALVLWTIALMLEHPPSTLPRECAIRRPFIHGSGSDS